MKTLSLKIEGMNCDGCAERIAALLEKEQGVREAEVSYSAGTGLITFNPHTVAEERILEVVDLAGFGAERA